MVCGHYDDFKLKITQETSDKAIELAMQIEEVNAEAMRTKAARVLQGAMRGNRTRQLMESGAIATDVPDSVYGERTIELAWVVRVLGIKFVEREDREGNPAGVVVTEVTSKCLYPENVNVGMLLEAVDDDNVASRALVDILSAVAARLNSMTADNPLKLLFRDTTESIVLAHLSKQFCLADEHNTGELGLSGVADVLETLYKKENQFVYREALEEQVIQGMKEFDLEGYGTVTFAELVRMVCNSRSLNLRLSPAERALIVELDELLHSTMSQETARAASTLQAAMQGFAVRKLWGLEAQIERIESSLHGEYSLEHHFLSPVLGIRMIARGGNPSVAQGVIVSQVTEECMHLETVKPGMLLDSVGDQLVGHQSFHQVMDLLEDSGRPLRLTFRATVEHLLLSSMIGAFKSADADMTGALDRAELAVVMQEVYKNGEHIARGKKAVEKEVDVAMAEFDADGSGQLTFREFSTMMCRSEAFQLRLSHEEKEGILTLIGLLEHRVDEELMDRGTDLSGKGSTVHPIAQEAEAVFRLLESDGPLQQGILTTELRRSHPDGCQWWSKWLDEGVVSIQQWMEMLTKNRAEMERAESDSGNTWMLSFLREVKAGAQRIAESSIDVPASVIQGVMRGMVIRRVMESEPQITPVEESRFGEYWLDVEFVVKSLGMKLLAREATGFSYRGVVVGEVQAGCLFADEIKPGMHLESLDGVNVAEGKFTTIMKSFQSKLEAGYSKPLRCRFRSTVECMVFTQLLDEFRIADADRNGSIDAHELANVYSSLRKTGFAERPMDHQAMLTAMGPYDADNDSCLTFAEFVNMVCKCDSFELSLDEMEAARVVELVKLLEATLKHIPDSPMMHHAAHSEASSFLKSLAAEFISEIPDPVADAPGHISTRAQARVLNALGLAGDEAETDAMLNEQASLDLVTASTHQVGQQANGEAEIEFVPYQYKSQSLLSFVGAVCHSEKLAPQLQHEARSHAQAAIKMSTDRVAKLTSWFHAALSQDLEDTKTIAAEGLTTCLELIRAELQQEPSEDWVQAQVQNIMAMEKSAGRDRLNLGEMVSLYALQDEWHASKIDRHVQRLLDDVGVAMCQGAEGVNEAAARLHACFKGYATRKQLSQLRADAEESAARMMSAVSTGAKDRRLVRAVRMEVDTLSELFGEHDTSGDGMLQLDELATVLRTYYKRNGVLRKLVTLKGEVETAMQTYDTDGDGTLELGEFVCMFARCEEFERPNQQLAQRNGASGVAREKVSDHC